MDAEQLDIVFAPLGAAKCRMFRGHRTPNGVPTPQGLVGYKDRTPYGVKTAPAALELRNDEQTATDRNQVPEWHPTEFAELSLPVLHSILK